MRLSAWADAARKANDYARMPVEQADIGLALTKAKAQLDGAVFEALITQGQALTMEQAVAEALDSPP